MRCRGKLSEMVHTTGPEMDGWGSSNSWRMDRKACGGGECLVGSSGESRAEEPCRAPDVSGVIKPILYQEQRGFFKYRCYVGETVKTS